MPGCVVVWLRVRCEPRTSGGWDEVYDRLLEDYQDAIDAGRHGDRPSWAA